MIAFSLEIQGELTQNFLENKQNVNISKLFS